MRRSFVKCSLLLAVTICLLGCDDEYDFEADSGPPPVGADIDGKWSGAWHGSGGSIAITAVIEQGRDQVTIDTDKPSPPGQHFTGRIDSNAWMYLIDAHDGEDWTTYHTHATETHVKISDFRQAPSTNDPHPHLNVIDLVR